MSDLTPAQDALLPAWEAVYEPGNVSDYLIGYANDEDAATGMAEAWMRSQAEVTGRLEWVDDAQMATGGYDRWVELIERHDDGADTGPGIVVRRRLAVVGALSAAPEPVSSAGQAPAADQPAPSESLEEALRGCGIYDEAERIWRSLSAEWIEEILREVLAVLPAPTDTAAEELASLAVNAGRALQDEKRHYQIACEENARLRATIARVRRLHDALDEETALTSPDDEITRGAAARKIAAALDGWTSPDELRRLADETQDTQPTTDRATLLALVRDFLDPDPCSFDHHGYCQAHGHLGGEPMSCPHGRARKLLAELAQPAVRPDGPADTPTTKAQQLDPADEALESDMAAGAYDDPTT